MGSKFNLCCTLPSGKATVVSHIFLRVPRFLSFERWFLFAAFSNFSLSNITNFSDK